MGAFTFDVAGRERCGVYDGYACALAEGASLQEQQQVDGDRSLSFNKTAVRQSVWEILAHVVADVAEVKRLEVAMSHEVEEHEYSHHLAVRHLARAVAVSLVRAFGHALFSTGLRFLQNSSIKQKISIKFAVVMGMDVFCVTYLFPPIKHSKHSILTTFYEGFLYRIHVNFAGNAFAGKYEEIFCDRGCLCAVGFVWQEDGRQSDE